MSRNIICFVISMFLFSCNYKKEEKETIRKKEKSISETGISGYSDTFKLLDKEIKRTKNFITGHKNYNSSIAFFIDMHFPSNKYRFFVIDLVNNIIIKRGIVAHGSGSKNNENGEMIFSNEVNSSCTSLGKYIIGESFVGRFGKSYRLYGLERSNSNSFKRAIILHKYESVPDTEQDFPICNSLGCPMVSPKYFNQLEKIIDSSTKKIILSIFY